MFNNYKHTSNSLDYLSMFSKKYNGENLYVHEITCKSNNLVTASSAGGLLWAKYIIEYLEVFPVEFCESWYEYFSTGNPKYYLELIIGV